MKDGVGNIGKWNWKHWKMELENEIGNIGKWNWKHWKMKLETLEIELETLEYEIGN